MDGSPTFGLAPIWPSGSKGSTFGLDIVTLNNAIDAVQSGVSPDGVPLTDNEATAQTQAIEQWGLEHWGYLTDKGTLQFRYKAVPVEPDYRLGIAPLIVKGPYNLQNLPKVYRAAIAPPCSGHVLVDLDLKSSHAALMACLSGCAPMIEAFLTPDNNGEYTGLYHAFTGERGYNKRSFNAWLNGGGVRAFTEAGHPNPDQFLTEVRTLMGGAWARALEWLKEGEAALLSSGLAGVNAGNARAHYLQRQEAYTVYRALTALFGEADPAWELSCVLVNRDGILLTCLAEHAQTVAERAARWLALGITGDAACLPDRWVRATIRGTWGADDAAPAKNPVGRDWGGFLAQTVNRWKRAGEQMALPIMGAALEASKLLPSDGSGQGWGRLLKSVKERKARALEWERAQLAQASGHPLAIVGGRKGSYCWLKDVFSQDTAFPVARYDIRGNYVRVNGERVDDRLIRTLYYSPLKQRYGLELDADNSNVGTVLEDVAYTDHAHDPVLDWFNALPAWDGVERVCNWVERYCRPVLPSTLDDDTKKKLTALYNTYGAKMLISLVARTYKPGCEVHTSLILSGKQGTGKTSLFKLLAPAGSYAAMSIDPANKDSVIEVSRYAMVEWGELSGLKKADMERLKDYWTKTFDDVRTPYARRSIVLQRRGIIVGSDNSGAIFLDPSGGRRWWVVPNGPIDLPGIEAIIPQLWAEALAIYRKGIAENQKELWYLSEDEGTDKLVGDVFFTPPDPLAEPVERLLDQWAKVPSTHPRSDKLLTVGALCHGLGVKIEQQGKVTQELVRTLKRLGYEPQQLGGGDRVRYWVKKD